MANAAAQLPPATSENSPQDSIRACLHKSLLRANQFQTPWPAEREAEIVAMWSLRLLEVCQPEDFPQVFKFAHETRHRSMFGKPLTLDDAIYAARKLKAGMVWSVRSDRWESADGEFYAPETVMERQ